MASGQVQENQEGLKLNGTHTGFWPVLMMLIWWKQTQTPHRKTKNLYQTLIKGLVWE
jgi:hypothetical protein